MYLSWLELTDVRCYETVRFEPEEGVNVLVGANGAGKTSILEAIAYLGLLKSFRGTPDVAMIGTGYLLRHSGVPRPWIGVIYAAVGSGLILASIGTWRRWRTLNSRP